MDNLGDEKFKNTAEVLDTLDNMVRDEMWGEKIKDAFEFDDKFRDTLEKALISRLKKEKLVK